MELINFKTIKNKGKIDIGIKNDLIFLYFEIIKKISPRHKYKQ